MAFWAGSATVAVRTCSVRPSARRKVAVTRCWPARMPRSVVQLARSPAADHLHGLVGDHGDEQVALGAHRLAVVDGPQAELGLHRPEHGLQVGQRGVGAPQRRVVPAGDVGAQAVDARVGGHGALGGAPGPVHRHRPGAGLVGDDLDVVVPGDTAVARLEAADALVHLVEALHMRGLASRPESPSRASSKRFEKRSRMAFSFSSRSGEWQYRRTSPSVRDAARRGCRGPSPRRGRTRAGARGSPPGSGSRRRAATSPGPRWRCRGPSPPAPRPARRARTAWTRGCPARGRCRRTPPSDARSRCRRAPARGSAAGSRRPTRRRWPSPWSGRAPPPQHVLMTGAYRKSGSV